MVGILSFVLKTLIKYGNAIQMIFQSRCSADALKSILGGLEWAGIVADEGPACGGPHGPYVQV